MVIHGLLVTCLDHLLFLFNCLKWCFVYGFENILKRGLCVGNLCNDSCLNIYKGVCLFEKIIQCFESCFEIVLKLFCEVCLKMTRMFCMIFDQVTKSCLPYFTQRSFLCF